MSGKIPDNKGEMIMFVILASRSLRNYRENGVGRGTSEQEVGFDFKIIAFNSALVIR